MIINLSRSRGKIFSLCFVSLFVFILAGCSTQKTWKYSIDPESTSPPIIEKSLAVAPFSDQRPSENSNYAMLYAIPLMPFGWQTFNTPEGAQMHVTSGLWFWRPNEDMAKATAEEINAAHIFKETFYTNRPTEGNLTLQGKINSTKYEGKLFSYCLSILGPDLWLIGFPAASFSNELDLSFTLKDNQNNTVLWEKVYHQEISKVTWIYGMKADFEYPDLLKKIMLELLNDLRANANTIKTKIK